MALTLDGLGAAGLASSGSRPATRRTGIGDCVELSGSAHRVEIDAQALVNGSQGKLDLGGCVRWVE